MGITEILRRIWLLSANKIKSSQSVSKQPTQIIVELNSSLWQKLGTLDSLSHFRHEEGLDVEQALLFFLTDMFLLNFTGKNVKYIV